MKKYDLNEVLLYLGNHRTLRSMNQFYMEKYFPLFTFQKQTHLHKQIHTNLSQRLKAHLNFEGNQI